MKTAALLVTSLLWFCALPVHAQWGNGIVMNVAEVDIAGMRARKMPGAEAVMKIIEQYADGQYRYAFVSYNYLIPQGQHRRTNTERNRFTVVVAGYPESNNLLYAQVFFGQSFFFVALAKNETDLKRSNDIRIIRMNYEKGNPVRRNNVRDTIQRNNIIPLGIDIMN